MSEIVLEEEHLLQLQEKIEPVALEVDQSQETNEHGAGWVINGCDIATEPRSFQDEEGHPITTPKESPRKVTFPKVPQILRKDERCKKYFDPKVVSFGPYHHGKPELKEAEMLKNEVMQEFIEKSGKTFEEFYNEVRKIVQATRACYVDGSTEDYSDDRFALMMLQDGCFILYVIDIWVHKRGYKMKEFSDLFGTEGFLNLTDDIILLENQIPFSVLELLMSPKYSEVGRIYLIMPFVYLIIWGLEVKEITRDKDEKPHVDHLLGLIQKEFSKEGNQNKKSPLFINFCKARSIEINERYYTNFVIPSFRSARELKEKGIHFKPINSSSSLAKKRKPVSLRDVEYRSGFFSGELTLPPLILDSSRRIFYYNLVAFELSSRHVGFVFSSYIAFLNTLISNPDDVKELRSKRILINNLRSDEEVVDMFKEISFYLLCDISLYQGVIKDVERHYHSKVRTWEAELINKYFRNPWTALGLFVATAVVVLTFVQTIRRDE